jgi:3-phosphoshikimate 1-carboxyvinyltransferase
MPLPDAIEIVPLKTLVRAAIAVPGSKSITNRALILAALAEGETILSGALWSEDTQVMVDALRVLGFLVGISPDPEDSCNRTITVQGCQGRIPRSGNATHPIDLFVGNAGTAARFLAALVCLGRGTYRLHGVPRMHERPQAELFRALRQLGYQVDSPNDRLPAVIHGSGPRAAECEVSIRESSQFASALWLSARTGQWQVHVTGENDEESPYVTMTRQLCASFPHPGGTFRIEPDASSGSYFWAAAWLMSSHAIGRPRPMPAPAADPSPAFADSPIVRHWPQSGWQVDARFPQYLPLPSELSRRRDLGDSIMTAMILAPFNPRPVMFTDLGRLRVQECERVAAMRTELGKCGAQIDEHDDSLTIAPSRLHGAEIETYQDHRVAMCFAVLGLKVPGIRLNHPACVKKTFPNFFQKLAAHPPEGLGVEIRDALHPRTLALPELFAD